MLAKIKVWCRHSATIAWSCILVAFGALLEVVPYAVDIIAAPDVSAVVHDALPAHWIGLYTIGVAIVTYACRLRTLDKAS